MARSSKTSYAKLKNGETLKKFKQKNHTPFEKVTLTTLPRLDMLQSEGKRMSKSGGPKTIQQTRQLGGVNEFGQEAVSFLIVGFIFPFISVVTIVNLEIVFT